MLQDLKNAKKHTKIKKKHKKHVFQTFIKNIQKVFTSMT